MRGSGLYDPLKVDVWSAGATAWELAVGEPPFSSGGAPPSGYSLPALPKDVKVSSAFEAFLAMCARPPNQRAGLEELLEVGFGFCSKFKSRDANRM